MPSAASACRRAVDFISVSVLSVRASENPAATATVASSPSLTERRFAMAWNMMGLLSRCRQTGYAVHRCPWQPGPSIRRLRGRRCQLLSTV
jgi:hypothetical protein